MDPASPHPWWRSFEARLLAGAFLLRLLYLATILTNPYFFVPITDEQLYHSWAREILAGIPHNPHTPYFDPPLHAYYLAAIYWVFGPSPLAVRIVQITIGALNVLLLYRLAQRLFDEPTARVAGLLAAAYAPFWYYEGLLLKESFALFLVDVVLLLLLGALARPRVLGFLSLGLAVGLLSLTRVNALVLAPACLIAIWLSRTPLVKAGLSFVVGLVLVITPVTVRNYLASGEWVLISAYGGQVLYNGNNPANTTGDYMPVPGVRPNPAFERVDFHRLAEQETGHRMTAIEVSRYWMQKSLAFAVSQPLMELKMIGWRVLRFINYQEIPDSHSFEQFKQFSFLLRLPFPGFWFIAPLALLGLLLVRRRWHELAPLYLFVGCYVLSLLPFWIFSRYRLPIIGILILFAAPALLAVLCRVKTMVSSRDLQTAWKPALGLGTLLVLCWLPLPPSPLSNQERNLAYAYEQGKEYDKAIAIYERLRKTERNPDNDLFLANALGMTGRLDEAQALFHQLEDTGYPVEVRQRTFNLQGDLSRMHKDWAKAEAAYRSALAIDATDYGAWNNLAVTLAGQQRYEEALQSLRRSIQLAPEDGLAQRNLTALQQYLAQLQPTASSHPAPPARAQ